MKKIKVFIGIAILAIVIFNSQELKSQEKQQAKAKYVFYFIGDGMGLGHVALTQSYLSAINDSTGFKALSFSQFPVVGLSTTHAETRHITGSAAAGTALATGHKTSIGTIGLKSNHKDTIWSVAHFAKKDGYKIGILSSVSINHATPAAFYAHQKSRNNYYEIAMQITKSNFDVFGGGGINYNTGKKQNMPDVYTIIQNAGYKYVNTKEDFLKLNAKDSKVLMCSPDLIEKSVLPYAINQKPEALTLADYTRKTIEILDNPNGFFIMAEGGKIDWAAHSNDAATVIKEVIDFDNAIKVALEFYKKHPEETLIIVTADHETGGLALGFDRTGYQSDIIMFEKQKASVEIYSEELNNFISQNSLEKFNLEYVLKSGKSFFGIEKLSQTDIDIIDKSVNEYKANHETFKSEYTGLHPVAVTWLKVLSDNAGIGWTSHAHTATPVQVWALGVGQEIFAGYYDNTDIPKKIAECMKLTKKTLNSSSK